MRPVACVPVVVSPYSRVTSRFADLKVEDEYTGVEVDPAESVAELTQRSEEPVSGEGHGR